MPPPPRRTFPSPIQIARRNAISKGLLLGDRKWLVIGGVVWVAHITRRALGKHPELVSIDRLEPGQWMSIRAIAAPTKKERKAAKAATRS